MGASVLLLSITASCRWRKVFSPTVYFQFMDMFVFVFLALAVLFVPLGVLKNYATFEFFASSFVSMKVIVSFLVKESNHAFLLTTNMKAFLGTSVKF